MSYTPGPWQVDWTRKPYSIKPDRIDPTSDFNNPLGVVFRSHVKGKEEEQIGNANLIAAAPDLIEACRYVVKYHRDNDSGEGELYGLDFVTTCIAAIRKAEGR